MLVVALCLDGKWRRWSRRLRGRCGGDGVGLLGWLLLLSKTQNRRDEKQKEWDATAIPIKLSTTERSWRFIL